MSDQSNQSSETPGGLRPGQCVQEAPFSVQFRAVQRPDNVMRFIMHIEHSAGATILPMPLEIAEQLFTTGLNEVHKAQGKPTGGLTVADITDLRRLQQGGT